MDAVRQNDSETVRPRRTFVVDGLDVDDLQCGLEGHLIRGRFQNPPNGSVRERDVIHGSVACCDWVELFGTVETKGEF